MNIKLESESIRLRLQALEAESLLSGHQLTIQVSWVTGDELKVNLVLSADAGQPRVRAEGLELMVIVPRSEFLELLEAYGRRNKALTWQQWTAQGKVIQWSLDIDNMRKKKPSQLASEYLEPVSLSLS